MWPSGFGLDSFCCFAGWILFSSILGEISASLVGRLSGKTLLGKNLFSVTWFQENPSSFWEKPVLFLVLIGVGCHFSLFILYRSWGDFCVGKTRLGKKKPLYCEENPWLFREKTSFWRLVCFLFGACRGGWPLLRLQSAVNSGKNPPWGKKKPLGKTPYLFRGNLF